MNATPVARIIGALLVLAGLAPAAHGADAVPLAAPASERAVILVPSAAIYPGDRITDGLILVSPAWRLRNV